MAVEEVVVVVGGVKTWVKSDVVRCWSGETMDLILEISSCRIFQACGMSALIEERTRAS